MPLNTDPSRETSFLEMPSGQKILSVRCVGKKSEETNERFIQYVHI